MAEPSPFGPGNPPRPSLGYLFLRFLRHGLLAWGGPVAQIGMMHRELVERDGWIPEARFRKVLALYQALPGPEGHGWVERVAEDERWHAFLLGVTAAVVGLIAPTMLPLAEAALPDGPTVVLAATGAFLFWKRWLPIPVVLLLSAGAGLALRAAVS